MRLSEEDYDLYENPADTLRSKMLREKRERTLRLLRRFIEFCVNLGGRVVETRPIVGRPSYVCEGLPGGEIVLHPEYPEPGLLEELAREMGLRRGREYAVLGPLGEE